MKIFITGLATAAIAATASMILGGDTVPFTRTTQFHDADLISQSYLYRGTGRRQILS